ncbi:MAG: gamma-glutamyl-gamma-aminobutyrate hydrolase family protein [Planctomycetes bacterium]|nr:gamma-glutamyl-gamma-aminobutyrate hydrolase family protein [Planctomycetota bacterium]
MKPVIAITCDHDLRRGREMSFLYADYYDAVAEAGAIPLLVPPLANADDARDLLAVASAVLFTGGDDLHPRHYGATEVRPEVTLQMERRERFELPFARLTLDAGLPLLGICAGAQLINAVRGGTLYQDLGAEVGAAAAATHRDPNAPPHARHEVRVAPGSLLSDVVQGAGRLMVNSIHHQAIRALAPGLRASAVAEDGVVEAVEDPARPFCLAVQWHPELLRHDAPQRRLFEALVRAAEGFRDAAGPCRAHEK